MNELSADSIVIQFGLGEIRAKPKLIKLNKRLIQLKGISLTQFFLSQLIHPLEVSRDFIDAGANARMSPLRVSKDNISHTIMRVIIPTEEEEESLG